MKFYLMLVFIYMVVSCSSNKEYYHGIVFYNQNPISGVWVKEVHNVSDSTVTDSLGYFKLKKNNDVLDNLTYHKEGFVPDTVNTVSNRMGEKINYLFLNKSPDTIFLKKQ